MDPYNVFLKTFTIMSEPLMAVYLPVRKGIAPQVLNTMLFYSLWMSALLMSVTKQFDIWPATRNKSRLLL